MFVYNSALFMILVTNQKNVYCNFTIILSAINFLHPRLFFYFEN